MYKIVWERWREKRLALIIDKHPRKRKIKVSYFCFYTLEPNVIRARKDLSFQPVEIKKLNYFLPAVKQILGTVGMGGELTQGRTEEFITVPKELTSDDQTLFHLSADTSPWKKDKTTLVVTNYLNVAHIQDILLFFN